MCGDSSTGTPVDPPVSNGNNGSGGQTTEPPTTPEPTPAAPKVLNIQLLSPVGDFYSREGEPPNLNGLRLSVTWDNNGTTTTTTEPFTAAGNDKFGTTPAILGFDHINWDDPEIAAPVRIDVYAKGDSTKSYSVEIPGVQALAVPTRKVSYASQSAVAESGATGANYRPNTQPTSRLSVASGSPIGTIDYTSLAVVGNGTIQGFTGAGFITTTPASGSYNVFTGITIYEDEFNAAPAIGGNLRANYQILYDKDTTNGNIVNNVPTKDQKQPSRVVMQPGERSIALNQDYLFYDYLSLFGTNTTFHATNNPYLPYGIDLANGVIYLLVSRGPGGKHGGSGNLSIYASVPFTETTFYYVRDIKVTGFADLEGEDENKQEYSDFFIQSDLVDLSRTKWIELLGESGIEFTVYYTNWSGVGNATKDRDATYWEYARKLTPAKAGIYNWNVTPRIPTPVVSVADNDDFGKVTIGYYASLRNGGTVTDDTIRNPIDYGDLGGFEVYDLPIAIFQEGSARMVLRPEAVQELGGHDGKLKLVVPGGTAGGTAAETAVAVTGARITRQQFDAIANTYKLVGDFYYEATNTTVVKELIDLKSAAYANIAPLWFGALATTEVNEDYELSINIRNIPTTVEADETTKKGMAALFNGQEVETLIVKLYPRGYDINN